MNQVTYVTHVDEVKDGKVVVTRHIDGGTERVVAPMPILLTVNGDAAPCRPRNAKLVMKYKRASAPMERPAEGLAYAEEYEKKPYLTIGWRLNPMWFGWLTHKGEGGAKHCV